MSFNQLALTSGILLAYLVDYAFAGIRGWRWMFGLAAVPASVLLAGMLFLPDSPRWLMSHGLNDRARAILQRIRGSSQVQAEIKEIRASLREQGGGWPDLLRPGVRPALLVGVGLAIFQQITGINTIIYYAPTIFQASGFQSASASILATAGVGAMNVLMTIVAIRLLDRVGRRPLLLAGLAGMVLSLGVLGVAFLLPNLSSVVGWVAVASLVVYVGSFALGLGPVFWLLISEIYPLKVRGLGMSVASVANWGANLAIALTFLSLVQAVGRPYTFWLYGVAGIASWFFAYFLVPETKGKTLEQIEAHWRTGKHPRAMGHQTSEDDTSGS